jgi:hypothetical protein
MRRIDMTFILTESLMNGTVTLNIKSTVVIADNFVSAVDKVIKHCDEEGVMLNIHRKDSKDFSYSVKDFFNVIYGHMGDKEAFVIQ